MEYEEEEEMKQRVPHQEVDQRGHGLDWIEQGLTSHQTHYRSYRGRVFTGQMKRTRKEVVQKGCQARKLNSEDAMDHIVDGRS